MGRFATDRIGRLLAARLSYRQTGTIEIAAPLSRVWSVLIDFDSYPVWNPLIRGASGSLDRGARLTIVVMRSGGTTAVERPLIAVIERQQELRLAEVLIPLVADSERAFTLAPGSHPGTCTVTYVERHRGLMATRRAPRSADGPAHPHRRLLAALRRRAEALHAGET